MASLTHAITPAEVVERHRREPRTVAWAFQDLEAMPESRRDGLVDAVARSAPATRQRIDYLFETGDVRPARQPATGLPRRRRPQLQVDLRPAGVGPAVADRHHRLLQHVHGPLRASEPAPHHHRARSRTAAIHSGLVLASTRVRHRTAMARMIGNAVPSRLSYAVALEWLR